MNPERPDVPSDSKVPSSNLAQLTASFAASGRERQSESLNLLRSVHQAVSDSNSSWKDDVRKLRDNIAEANLAAESERKRSWSRNLISVLISAAGLVLAASVLWVLMPLAQLASAKDKLTAVRAEVREVEATRQAELQKLQQTRTVLRQLARWAPIARFQLLRSNDPARPFIIINPDSIRKLDGKTIALPELSMEK